MATNGTMTCAQFWEHVKEKAAAHIASVTENPEPETESEVKDYLAEALKHGSCAEAADVIAEVCEWQLAHLMEMKAEVVGTAVQ